jgi:hypothetical protein
MSRVLLQARASAYDAASITTPIGTVASQVQRPRVLVVLESALCPVILADTGGVLWNAPQVEALLRHRFRLAYGGRGIDVSSWKLRTMYRYGDRHALGFAMPPAVEAALVDAARQAGVRFKAWTTAFSWGVDRCRPWRAWPKGIGWWAWAEQDRVLLGHFTRRRIDAIDPAIPLRALADGLCDLIESEQRRLGLAPNPEPLGAAVCWRFEEQPSNLSDRLRWSTLESSPQPSVSDLVDLTCAEARPSVV